MFGIDAVGGEKLGRGSALSERVFSVDIFNGLGGGAGKHSCYQLAKSAGHVVLLGDDGGTGLSSLSRKINPQFGIDNIQDAFSDLAGIHGSGILEKELLLIPILGTGSLAFIQTDFLRLGES